MSEEETTTKHTDGPPAIQVINLHRHFGELKAVDGVSFTIPKGRVVGFVGANGAGKTTTMRILATLDYPTAGRIFIHGTDIVNYPTRVRRMLGWMPDSFGTYDHMTVIEYLDFFARALGYHSEERIGRVDDVMAFTDLAPLSDRLINKLSKGMGQRLCLGRALIHDPEVLILDEPAAGLDPKARVELKNLIRILAEEGKTILISSHILSELGEMCDSMLFIDNGKIVHHGDADTLKKNADGSTVIDVQITGAPEKLYEWVQMSPHVELVDEKKAGGRIKIDSHEDETIAGVLRKMVSDGLPVIEFHREERNLEDAFIHILGEIGRGNPTPVPVPGETPPVTAPPPIPTTSNPSDNSSLPRPEA